MLRWKGNQMTYDVEVMFTGSVVCTIDAPTEEEAIEIAEKKVKAKISQFAYVTDITDSWATVSRG
jgi:hypothetical protein